MTTKSKQSIESELLDYSSGLDYWSADFGETGDLLDSRRWLHERVTQLTAEQRASLEKEDARARALYAKHHDQAGKPTADPHRDILLLGAVVALINSERAAAA